MKKVLVIGSINMDMVMDVDHMAQVGETIISKKKIEYNAGGKGANQAYTLGKLGGNVAMLGAVGKDEYGQILLDSLKSVNVDTSAIKIDEDETTGLAIICVDKHGDNSIIVSSGANMSVSIEYIEENIKLFNEADIIVMQLEVPLETVEYCVKLAQKLGKFIILDTAPAVPDLSEEILAGVDIIKPNETELEILCPSESTVENRCEYMLKKGVKNVIATLGAKGSMLYNKDGTEIFEANEDIKPVDTTAAGDSFTASVALSIAKGESIREAIIFASKVAEITITRKGAQCSIPTLDEVI